MIKKTFKDLELPALGFGCMRFPVIDGDMNNIDQAQVDAMTDYAMEHGVNYFDTGYGYHNGLSEVAMGKALARYPRESFMVADKYPGYDTTNFGKTAEIFEEQLKRCGLEYFDFYLFHNVCELNIEQYLDDQYDTFEYLKAQVENGRIRHLGFSTHGSLEVMKRFLDKYGADLEFCQIQLNYADYEFQDARAKIALLAEHGLPVWVMEPVRGGKLAKLDEKYSEKLRALRPETSDVEWAFRFIQDIPEVTLVLSGMSSIDQMQDNVRIFSDTAPLSAEGRDALLAIGHEIVGGGAIPCTACRYCTEKCPKGLNIPWLLELYNEAKTTEGGGFIAPMALASLPEDKLPSACVKCGACAKVCPQMLQIPDLLQEFAELAEPVMKAFRK